MQPPPEQFTEKAWGAIVAAQQMAQQAPHQQLETTSSSRPSWQSPGLATRILEKSGVGSA